MEVIGRARNGFRDKFGVPRQPREESAIETRIVFDPKYRQEEALRGIEGFSHLWVLWIFDKAVPHTNNTPEKPANNDNKTEGDGGTFRATVRPPRLGGNTRVGVFATRSPFRPNPELREVAARGEDDKRRDRAGGEWSGYGGWNADCGY